MIKKIIGISLLATAFSANADFNINTSHGKFSISSKDSVGIQDLQTYKINNKVVGHSEYIEVDGKLLGMSDGSDYLVIRGSIGASACAEALSIVEIKGNKASFSPSLHACGGVDNVSFNNGVVTVTAWARDGETLITYVVDGKKVLENGKGMLTKYSFLSR
ncbi:hypothetical protein J7438_23885 [Thalassotalea sp. G20_0]|uniref:hypothetical protein n=1 Tax=Thalassotalea sp. G20_0 TaxID=2821093 RepID=UPI001ADAF643|nr:hypothetical protein [Thalassotalea sp. G20_0]MBO9497104.1 hypothetical protein [Thalassotalea sp. G20_0]